ncbi:hypothetical protein OC834_006844 [Tilletia horrida]|nr:hypothetical protein OC834_006844 [Tilletia horrida]
MTQPSSPLSPWDSTEYQFRSSQYYGFPPTPTGFRDAPYDEDHWDEQPSVTQSIVDAANSIVEAAGARAGQSASSESASDVADSPSGMQGPAVLLPNQHGERAYQRTIFITVQDGSGTQHLAKTGYSPAILVAGQDERRKQLLAAACRNVQSHSG